MPSSTIVDWYEAIPKVVVVAVEILVCFLHTEEHLIKLMQGPKGPLIDSNPPCGNNLGRRGYLEVR